MFYVHFLYVPLNLCKKRRLQSSWWLSWYSHGKIFNVYYLESWVGRKRWGNGVDGFQSPRISFWKKSKIPEIDLGANVSSYFNLLKLCHPSFIILTFSREISRHCFNPQFRRHYQNQELGPLCCNFIHVFIFSCLWSLTLTNFQIIRRNCLSNLLFAHYHSDFRGSLIDWSQPISKRLK